MPEDVEEQMIRLNEQQTQLYLEGKYEQAFDFSRQVCILAQQHLEQDHRYVADSLNNLAVLYMEIGKYSEAEPLYMKALGIYRRTLAGDDPDIATILSPRVAQRGCSWRESAPGPLSFTPLEKAVMDRGFLA